MATSRISVNVDSDVIQNVQRILSEIGMDMTTTIELLLKTIVREEKIPFELRTPKILSRRFVWAIFKVGIEKIQNSCCRP
ncbi:MAG: type II toxin-antitoxin system RelB/DinJ family antitoxin [Oscillospiraceae bacterium]|nr:type II toxin-antitoxin system RelB/DinJ family antitoxin [Oscillospiraceae bacterium]